MDQREQWHAKPVNEELGKKLRIISWVLTVVVLALVSLMQRTKIPVPEGFNVSFLPAVHALINTTAAIVLIWSLVAVKRGNIDLHRKLMGFALVLSILFLLSYVTYHFTTLETKFGDANRDFDVDDAEKAAVGIWRTVYLAVLLPHILLAAISLPFILLALSAALSNDFVRHKRMARIAYPMWLFVAVTGPICYLMLRPYYG